MSSSDEEDGLKPSYELKSGESDFSDLIKYEEK